MFYIILAMLIVNSNHSWRLVPVSLYGALNMVWSIIQSQPGSEMLKIQLTQASSLHDVVKSRNPEEIILLQNQ